MPIRLPVQTIIRANDFHNKAFSFPVESIVALEWMIGNLVVNATEGYLLTTSLTTEPKQSQDFPYKKHPNGQWIAEGTVTLLFTGDQPTTGKIIIHNSLDEKIVLTVDISTSLALSKPPELTVSDSVLTIMQSAADRPGFGLLTISQTHANTPVSISTDMPDYFLLASDSRPTFGPTLVVVPSATGTYVHIRYSSSKRGRNRGQLFIEAPYDSATVTLEGQKMSLLPALQTSIGAAKPVYADNEPTRKRWITGLTIVLLAGLALAGYTYKCQLFPSLCQNRTANQPIVPNVPPPLEPAIAHDTLIAESELDKVIRSTIKPSVPLAQSDSGSVRQSNTDPIDRSPKQTPAAKAVIETSPAQSVKIPPKISARPTVDNQLKARAKRRQDSTSADEESDLEKALNPPN